MHWIFLANGDCAPNKRIREVVASADYVVGVDGGCRHLHHLGKLPHLVIGDMDSIPAQILTEYKKQGVRLQTYPRQKEATDLELALNLAVGKASQVTILGATGGRLDHTLGNLFLIAKILPDHIPVQLMDNGQTIYVTRSLAHIHGTPGDLISLLPLTADVTGISITGCQYPLRDATLTFGSTQGISNVLAHPEATIALRSGIMAVFHLYDET